MKKITKKIIAFLCAALVAVPVFFAVSACDPKEETPETVDYVTDLKLDMSTSTKKQEVTVRTYIDGDTTHFNPVGATNEFDETQGYIKARYLAINTPESTGKIEKWGKTASNFTHDTLENAESIIVESDDGNWNIDSTGSRYLLWIWYKPKGGTEYRNLNVEILQNGYAFASATASNRYGEIAVAALNQAKDQQLHVYSNDVDPNFYEGAAIAIDLKELRYHMEDYLQYTVRVEGVVTADYSDTVYIEDYDAETDTYFGIQVYYGRTATAALKKLLKIGNVLNVVGSLTEFNGTYQLSGLKASSKDTEANTTKVGEIDPSFREVSAKDIASGKLTVAFDNEEAEGGVEEITLDYGEAIMSTSVTVSNLTVVSINVTTDPLSDDYNAMTLTCRDAQGNQIKVRTEPFKENGVYVKPERFENKTITVKGIIDYYYGYQVKVFLLDWITVL